MIAAIFLPAIFILVSALRLFLAVADGLDGVGTNAIANQRLLGRVSTTLTQRQIVLSGTAVVAVAFNLHLPAFLLEDLFRLRQFLLRIVTQIRLVIIEENVPHRLCKELFVCHGWRWNRSWRRRRFRGYRNLSRGFLRAGRALGGQMIRGGLRRRDGL